LAGEPKEEGEEGEEEEDRHYYAVQVGEEQAGPNRWYVYLARHGEDSQSLHSHLDQQWPHTCQVACLPTPHPSPKAPTVHFQ
jgi:hypothetical protein